jgi:hypothetical protein
MKKLLFLFVFFALFPLSSLAADSPWIGTWKLDPSQSNFTGDTFTYSKTPNGMMHFSDGSTVNYDFSINGKEYKTIYGRTTTWTAAGDNSWDTVTMLNGAVLSKSHREISSDGKTLTITTTGNKPDGTSFKEESVYNRVTKTTGLVGKWRSAKVDISAPDTFIISAPSADTLHWEIPSYKETVEGKPDGTDHPITGPTAPPGLTLAFKMVSPNQISYVLKVKGKPDGYGTQTLSADGKSFTDVSWSPGKQSEKSTGFYARQ